MRYLSISILVLFLPFLNETKAQDNEQDGMAKKGLIRSQGGFCSGFMPDKGNNIYLDGSLEYYFHDRFSYRADISYRIQNDSDAPFEENSSLFSGFMYHFRDHVNFDPYVGFQPGLSLSKEKEPIDDPTFNTTPRTVNSVVSGVVGVNYYGPAVFHLLLEARYIHGTHFSRTGSLPLNEFRVTFGLGLNFNVLEPFWKD